MDNQQVSPAEIGWLAGIFDGEAYIGFNIEKRKQRGPNEPPISQHVKMQIKVTNTDYTIVEKTWDICKRLGANMYKKYDLSNHHLPNRKMYGTCETKHMYACEIVLSATLPYLTGNKKQRAELMLEFLRLRKHNEGTVDPHFVKRRIRPYTQEEWNCVSACYALQARGTSTTAREARQQKFDSATVENGLQTT